MKVDPCFTDFDAHIKDQPVYYVGQLYANEDYIYALCLNSKGSGSDATFICELHIWNWSGEPLGCYSFDRKVSLVAFSEKYHKIYALDNMIDDELYIYDMPKID